MKSNNVLFTVEMELGRPKSHCTCLRLRLLRRTRCCVRRRKRIGKCEAGQRPGSLQSTNSHRWRSTVCLIFLWQCTPVELEPFECKRNTTLQIRDANHRFRDCAHRPREAVCGLVQGRAAVSVPHHFDFLPLNVEEELLHEQEFTVVLRKRG